MNSIVAVPGIGAYSVGTLMAEIRSKMTALSDMSASKDPSAFRNMKLLFDKNIVGIMLDALVTAFDDLEYIRKKGGLSSRSIPKNVFDSVKDMNEGWSKKYKDSINCSNPKGFSQKAHCAGKKKRMVEGFKEYMNLVADKKCPDGFKFDTKLQVCVPKGNKYIIRASLGEIDYQNPNEIFLTDVLGIINLVDKSNIMIKSDLCSPPNRSSKSLNPVGTPTMPSSFL